MNDLVLCIVPFTTVTAASKLSEVLDVIIAGVTASLEHICYVGVTIHVISHVVTVIVGISRTPIVLDNWLAELELLAKANLAELRQQRADSVAVSGLKLASGHVQLDA